MKKITIPTPDEARLLVEEGKIAQQKHEALLKKDAQAKRLEQESDPDELAYKSMVNRVALRIKCVAYNLRNEATIKIEIRQNESIENKRDRAALNRLKPILREMGYQTLWNHDIIEDDGFNREMYDCFTISWDPSIRWNEFRD